MGKFQRVQEGVGNHKKKVSSKLKDALGIGSRKRGGHRFEKKGEENICNEMKKEITQRALKGRLTATSRVNGHPGGREGKKK